MAFNKIKTLRENQSLHVGHCRLCERENDIEIDNLKEKMSVKGLGCKSAYVVIYIPGPKMHHLFVHVSVCIRSTEFI